MNENFIREVESRIALRGAARDQALGDLRDLLATVPASELGSPAEYAETLNALFESDNSLLGIPLSLLDGLGSRIAGTFDPADERLVIPRLIGLGWTLNLGRLAVMLGLLRPDDVDDEVLADATRELGPSQMGASVAVVAAAASTALLASRRAESEAVLGESLASSLVFGTLLPAVSAALIAGSASERLPSAQRLTMPAIAASLATLSASACLQQAVRPTGKAIALSGIALAAPLQLALSYLPVRAALRRRWTLLGK